MREHRCGSGVLDLRGGDDADGIFLARLTISAIVSTLGCLSASGLLPSYTPIALTDDLCPVMYADIELAESVAIESYPDVVTLPR